MWTVATYVLKQKLVSLGNNFTITDIDGHEAFQVRGELATLGDKLSFQESRLYFADYREVEKARIRAILEYVGSISSNAALFMRAAQALRRHPSS